MGLRVILTLLSLMLSTTLNVVEDGDVAATVANTDSSPNEKGAEPDTEAPTEGDSSTEAPLRSAVSHPGEKGTPARMKGAPAEDITKPDSEEPTEGDSSAEAPLRSADSSPCSDIPSGMKGAPAEVLLTKQRVDRAPGRRGFDKIH